MLEFIKMHGLGNDYVYMDAINQSIKNRNELAKKVSDRHFGIGADGLILICDSDICDFKMRMFNADGSEAEMCGNGIRCVGKYVYDHKLTDKKNITVETLAGVKVLELFDENGYVEKVKVDMGRPIFDNKDIAIDNKDVLKKFTIKVLDRDFNVTYVSMGNPHAIIVVDDLDNFDVDKYGSIIEKDEHFPNGTNVEFVEIKSRKDLKMRVYERGSGETMACGTGACASVVACKVNGLVDEDVKVELRGGDLDIDYDKDDSHVYMSGGATTVFETKIELKLKRD